MTEHVIIVLETSDSWLQSLARRTAEKLGTVAKRAREVEPGDYPILRFDDDRVAFHHPEDESAAGLSIDFRSLDVRPGRISRKQPLGRAIGKNTTNVVDATAGLGQDAVLLAAMGCRVIAIERNPIVAALLEDGVRKAHRDPAIAPAIEDRLEIRCGNSIEILQQIEQRPEAVYVDPMFPPKRKSSALAKKQIRIVRDLVGSDADASELVDVARRIATRRVVVKRSHEAEPLHPDPDLTMKSKLLRYDVYFTATGDLNQK